MMFRNSAGVDLNGQSRHPVNQRKVFFSLLASTSSPQNIKEICIRMFMIKSSVCSKSGWKKDSVLMRRWHPVNVTALRFSVTSALGLASELFA